MDQQMLVARIVGGVVAGLIAGIFPMLAANKRNNTGMGVGAMLLCGVCGAILGLLLAIPVACLLTYFINKQPVDGNRM